MCMTCASVGDAVEMAIAAGGDEGGEEDEAVISAVDEDGGGYGLGLDADEAKDE